MNNKLQFPVLILISLILFSCGNKSEKTEALPAHNVTERIKEDWSKVEKPLEIIVAEREKDELEAIGSLGIWIEGKNENKPVEFHFDGVSFKPISPLMVESSIKPIVFYPYKPDMTIADTLIVQSPLSQYLKGNLSYIETKEDKIIACIELKELTALLRFRFQSDDLSDILESVRITGKNIATKGLLDFLKGELLADEIAAGQCEINPECMMNNGRSFDFHLIPTEEGGDLEVTIEVNGKIYQISTTIPPLREGSITELRLKLNNGKLSVGSSWVDTKHPFIKPIRNLTDSVKHGYWLQKDGLVSPGYNENCIALIIETDGKHGKAVSLKDIPNPIQFIPFQTGKIFVTVDGNNKEGCYRGNLIIENEELIEYSPSVKYSDKCAFSVTNGSGLFQTLMNGSSEDSRKQYAEAIENQTAYIPSLRELVQLSAYLISKEGEMPEQFIMPEGFYMTVCESGEDTFYSLNPITCRISAYNSKKYSNVKQRLFYLF